MSKDYAEIKELLYDYFILNSTLSLPGIGTFSLFRLPAQVDFINKKMIPPSFTISFDKMQDAPRRDLFDYLSRRLGVPEWEAVKLVNDLAFHIKDSLRQGSSIEWTGIGQLHPDGNETIRFEASRLNYAFTTDVEAHRVIRQHAEHPVRVGDQEKILSVMEETLADKQAETGQRNTWLMVAAFVLLAGVLIAFRFFISPAGYGAGRADQLKPAIPAPTYTLQNQP